MKTSFWELYTILSGLFQGYSQWLDRLAIRSGFESDHYAVVIDAGSSGSRVHAYKFRVPFSLFGSKSLQLVEESYEATKPGLSSYRDDPAKGAQTIANLIKNVEHLIPYEKRKDTPLLVRATAGLRQLPEGEARALIEQVSRAVSSLGFNTSGNSVDIMSGVDEGIAIWYAVNFLKGLTNGGSTMAALDASGGSSQITYEISADDADKYPARDIHVFPHGMDVTSTLFAHSYHHLGNQKARYGVLRLELYEHNKTMGHDEFTSVCVHPTIRKVNCTYFNNRCIVSGAPQMRMSPEQVYSRCHKLVREYAMMTLDFELQEPPRGKVAAMGFFYWSAFLYDLTDKKGGTVSIKRCRSRAIRACSEPQLDQPWACFDLVYMVTLLQDVYKMQDSHTVTVYETIDGYKVSWALGLAYTYVFRKIARDKAAIVL